MNKFRFKSKYNQMAINQYSNVRHEKVHIDFAEISKKKEGQARTKSFLVLIDEATRLVNAKAMKEDAQSVVQYLKSLQFIAEIKTIVSDCGKSFMSDTFKNFCYSYGIKHITSAPYHPAGNGLVERKMRDLKKFLKCYDNDKGNWKEKLEFAVRHENRSFHEYLGCSPIFAMYGKSEKLKADDIFDVDDKILLNEKIKSDVERDRYRQRMKRNFHKKHSEKVPKIQIGDLILVQKSLDSKKRSKDHTK